MKFLDDYVSKATVAKYIFFKLISVRKRLTAAEITAQVNASTVNPRIFSTVKRLVEDSLVIVVSKPYGITHPS